MLFHLLLPLADEFGVLNLFPLPDISDGWRDDDGVGCQFSVRSRVD